MLKTPTRLLKQTKPSNSLCHHQNSNHTQRTRKVHTQKKKSCYVTSSTRTQLEIESIKNIINKHKIIIKEVLLIAKA